MPAFSFEKIPSPPRVEPAPQLSPKKRGRIARLVDRLTEMRLKSYDARTRGRAGQHRAKAP